MSGQEVVSETEATKCCRKINWVSYCLSVGAGWGGVFESPGLSLTLGV